ncbi:hypothetical protein DM860_012180 [Cuscuta australis]|uniref:Uncharacterized protein n=1 Tax=Cuscuta australis TaxID=267555 RepID=A0A328E6B9_9ASTE|nr:hypothetical protein DM860_012180 [Cuscuta australis]
MGLMRFLKLPVDDEDSYTLEDEMELDAIRILDDFNPKGEHHNHPMVSTPRRPFLKLNRNLDIGHKKFMLNCEKANIGTMKSYRLSKESVGGYDNVGATAVDFKNFRRDLKAYIAGGESNQLTRLFWCDPVARKNYTLFGDVVSFDATYETNIKYSFFDDFTGQNFSLVELLMQFESAMDSQRHKNADDEACYPEFKTPLDIEHHAASVYTLTIFYEVQMEISAACFSCRVLHVEELDVQLLYPNLG